MPHEVPRLLCLDHLVLKTQRVFSEPAEVEHRARHDAVAHAREQHARIGRLHEAEGLRALADLGGEAVDVLLACLGTERRPGRERRLRSADGCGHLRRISLAHLAQHALVDGRAQLEALGAGDPLAVDVVQGRDAMPRDVDRRMGHGLASPSSANIFPGFSSPLGSSAALTERISARSTGDL